MKKLYIIGLLLFSLCAVGFSQSMDQYIEAADTSFQTKDYYSALIYYSKAIDKSDGDRIDLVYKAAESARLFDAYSDAEEKYQMVIDMDNNKNEYPLANFYLADVKQRKGDYDGAYKLYEFYKSTPGFDDDPYFVKKALKEMEACIWAKGVKLDSSITIVQQKMINTPYSDFGAVEHNDSLYYSSLAYEDELDTHKPKRLRSKVLKAGEGKRGGIINGGLNEASLHTAHTAFSGDGSRMYYTICDFINSSEITCDIYYREVLENGDFGPSTKLPDHINLEGSTSTQPNVGYDKEMKKEVLFFVSDRKGGEGKKDIWKSVIDANWNFSEPINIKAINTIEDDISPFYHRGTNILYFSSNGHQSMGGFDIRKSKFVNGAFVTSENLPKPINGSYHDVYFSLNKSGEKAYFSSNREGALYLDESKEACCFDVYRADYAEILIALNALTYDESTLLDLPGATVQLIDTDTGEIIGDSINMTSNDHTFSLLRDRNYTLIATHPDYQTATVEFNTYDIYKSTEIIKKLYLKQNLINLDVFTFDKKTQAELNGATVELINITTGLIEEVTQTNENGNDFHWKIKRGMSYKITATKLGYTTDLTTFETTGAIKGNKIVKKLYLQRSFLPIVLYFDNDIPDVRSIKTYTNKTYTETFEKYILRKEEFKNNHGQNQDGLENFFEKDVRGGYDRLNRFIEHLVDELRTGRSITINVKGYASPRAASKYNLILGERRISSLKNELVQYKGGILSSYITNGSLSIENISFGEETAPAGISDSLNDVKNSIYSVEASRERRIELVNLTYN